MTVPSGWKVRRLTDFIELQRGFDLPHRLRRIGPYKVLTSGEAHGWHAEAKVSGPGFVVGRASNIGRPTWSDEDFWPLNTTLFAKDLKGNDPKFAYYWFLGNDLSAYNSGSVQAMLNRNYIANVPIKVPPVEEQRAIAATLGAFDDKIESNRRSITLALSLATANYERTARSALRKRLGDHATLVLGGTPSRKKPELWDNGSINWISSGSANAEIIMQPTELITKEALAHSAAKMMPKGATVIAITGATLGQVALLGIDTSGNQSLVGVWAEDPAITTWLHFALRASMDELMKSATGAAQQHVNKGNVAELMVPIPETMELDTWAAGNVPLMKRCVQLEAESQKLTAIRDALLPELLSGRIRATEVEGA